MPTPDFTLLSEVYALAQAVSVSFSLHFDESNGRWYYKINSPSDREFYYGREHTFEIATELVIAHLRECLKPVSSLLALDSNPTSE